ncbi:hypothetical protein VB716_00205 [Synechococcus sp. CCY9201]|uniref:hypothetical protein n=1 Tax=unclassified Synechococcus TaxID=2626047 RepID=UPI002B21271C|nr:MULTISPECIES: hypothetical protein [unclassified Synechococcus]MEA5421914.1 hypothetical protein [Synechococcus sp. CCY9202]MEA5472644.1 hypothetical protein [Synechococcus sp. CCY9201]
MSDEPRWNSRPGSGRRGDDPLEQRLDRWVSAGRQLVDGVSGARPGSRPSGRGATPRAGSRPRLDDLGRWMGDKLDWLLDDNDDDWREPWQQNDPTPRRPEPEPPVTRSRDDGSGDGRFPDERSTRWRSGSGASSGGSFNAEPFTTEPSGVGRSNRGASRAGQGTGGRRPLEAISRRQRAGGSAGTNPRIASSGPRASQPVDSRSDQARPAETRPPRSEPDTPEEWPDQADFSLTRWQRPSPGTTPTAPTTPIEREAGGRPLPRSSRRRP